MFISVMIMLLPGCRHQPGHLPEPGNEDISRIIARMTELMVHDVTNPPLASRFFAYACLAGYEVVSQNDSNFRSMHGLLNEYPDIKKPDSISNYSYPLAALMAMLETAKKMQPSGKLLEQYEDRLSDSCRKLGYDDEVIAGSKSYAQAVSKSILAYAKADGYNKLSNLPRYTPADSEGAWYPTPPAYIAAVEPYFCQIRSFTLDSANQFKPQPPVPFSRDKHSGFYKLLMQNYHENDQSPEEHRVIAAFWDCNPFAVQDEGHLMVGLKKISPGAHWLGITGIACMQSKKSFAETMQIYTAVSVGLMESFICCWGEKYRSNRIRPETAIRKYVDPQWKPLLQTPPFPEYLSGHSCVSATSAVILTRYFGDHYHFRDSVEINFGLQPRSFDSFKQASAEAAISRFYGGIHFMDAIDIGVDQGARVGEWVLHKLKAD